MYVINEDIERRLEACHATLISSFQGGGGRSAAMKGAERETFISGFLNRCLPPASRLGTGDIVDAYDNHSGQVDIVVESPYLYSFPLADSAPRLYPAEAVGAVIEVKSDLSAQWGEVEKTYEKIKDLRKTRRKTRLEQEKRRYEHLLKLPYPIQQNQQEEIERRLVAVIEQIRNTPNQREDIPFYAVGFNGWKKTETVSDKRDSIDIDGVIVLNESLYSFAEPTFTQSNTRQSVMMTRNFADIKGLWYFLDMVDRHIKDTFDQIELQDSYQSHIIGKPVKPKSW